MHADFSRISDLVEARKNLVWPLSGGLSAVAQEHGLGERRCYGCIGESGEIAARAIRSWRNDPVSKGCQAESLESRVPHCGLAPTPCVVPIH